jgi:hypothetical protein
MDDFTEDFISVYGSLTRISMEGQATLAGRGAVIVD